ncbi:MAG: ABC transporter ATP-binding protein [Acetivibrionales bacterium]
MKGKKVIIRTENLTKRYGSLVAVNNLNLEIEEGEVFGLLGPNGAGKTTTILMLLGLTEPDDGKASINEFDCTRNPIAVKRIAGYLPDNVGFYDDLTGRENLRFTGQLNGMEPSVIEQRIDSLLKRVNLEYAADKKAGTYSRGMKQRLGIADVLMKDPKVVILDEPTLGIDPEGIRELLALIKELSKEDGRTVLVSSHQLHQVQQICDRVGIFVEGRLVASGHIESLGKQVLSDEDMVIEFAAYPDNEELVELIKSMQGVKEVIREKGMFLIKSSEDIRSTLSSQAVREGYSLSQLRLRGGDLDDIYRRYFSREGVA